MFKNKKVLAALWAIVIGLGLFFWVTNPNDTPAPSSPPPGGTPPARPPAPQGEPITDYRSFIEELDQEGYLVEIQETITQPFFAVSGRALLVDGNRIQVFEFRDGEEAEQEARRIPADGSSFSSMIVDWTQPPHFYREGKIIVIYLGDNAGIMRTLQEILGAQFAGFTGNADEAARDLPFAILREDDNGVAWNSGAWCETIVITSFADWKRVWDGTLSSMPIPPIPSIDFSREMVVGIEHRSLRPKVQGVRDIADAVILELDYKPLPISHAPVVKNPYIFVKTERVLKPVVFQNLESVAACHENVQ